MTAASALNTPDHHDTAAARSTAQKCTVSDAAGPAPRTRAVSLAALLVGTTVLYLWNLSANGWANSFYTAAIQAGSQSWKAWFFGSSDMANSITVDKPPASLWIPGLAVRVFGLSSWSVLVPEVLMGVASVALLYVITRRVFGHWAGIGAGVVLALTPVAALMFRFDNPEALLILLMIAAIGALLKAIETGRMRWMILAGTAIGFGFLAKQLEVMLIVPAMVLLYFAAAPGTWLRRCGHLFVALASLIVSAGWWVVAVELWPVSSRPYIGGSQHNSILELTFGYNGFGRLNGNEEGSVGGGSSSHGGTSMMNEMAGGPGGTGGPGGGMGWGQSGPLRMFDAEQGGQIAWLIPAALIMLVAALVLIGRAPRTDRRRAYLLAFAGWLLTMGLVFSFMAGIFHSYYTAALAPGIAATLSGSVAVTWPHRRKLWVRLAFAVSVWFSVGWAFALLARSSEFVPWLRWVVVVVGAIAGVLMLIAPAGGKPWHARVAAVAAAAAIVAGLAGPVAYTLDTVGTAKEGSIISAGPEVAGAIGGPGGRHGGPGGGRFGPPSMPGQGGASQGGTVGGPGGGPGGMGGLLNGSKSSEEMTATLRADADRYTWVAAAVGAMEASGYQIAADHSVMPIGGFNGTDPSPTLEEFKAYVAAGRIHYFIGGNRDGGDGRSGFGPGGSSGTSAQIKEWVTANFPSTTVDGTTLYDLTAK
ncbi:ArnT family glycosyltransferase [Gordonia zhaorongruii]|uniref:ArnT family glycosyltransferase n=1 Tax=Gordonia zhaorongruii TaxID=2597659 RepID=UPI00104F2E4B|nr:glycosyltransferase family 39 protein [Gordonia zhaorongruii]